MLLRKNVLARIATGEVSVAFRRWKRPTVKAGARLRTSIGELSILTVEVVDPATISDDDITASEVADRAQLEHFLSDDREGEVYRVTFTLGGPDTRAALRERSELSDEEYASIRGRLERMDRLAAGGAWTAQCLAMIEAQPDVAALTLAESIGMERAPFKANVRKLKEYGLTESRRPGYRLSPCGAAYLARLRAEQEKG